MVLISALGERTLLLLLTDTDSIETMVKHGLNVKIVPTPQFREVVTWSLTYYQQSGKAPTIDVLKERFTPDKFSDQGIDLDEDVEETIEWAIGDLEGTYVQQQVGLFTRELATEIASAPPEERVARLGALSSKLAGYVLDLQPKTTHMDIRESGPALLAEYEMAASSEGVRGMTLGIDVIDRHFGGIWPGEMFVLGGPAGCLAGDTMIQVCRGGVSGKRTIESLVSAFNGKHKTKPWRPDIQTYVQRGEGSHARLALLGGAWESGVKETFTLTTASGRTLRGTAEHPFQVADGHFVPLGELSFGDQVRINIGKSSQGRGKKPYYRSHRTLFHPYQVNRGKKAGYSVPEHRLVVEAMLNNLSLSRLLDIVRSDQMVAATLTYLSPDLVVHHIDRDTRNNDLSNLRVMTHQEHHRLHAHEGKGLHVLDRIDVDPVVSIKKYGEEMTYDLTVEDDPHNYVANGFVVHNTGKSFFADFVAHHEWGRGRPTTLFTLENSILMTQMRIACCALHISIEDLQNGTLEPDQVRMLTEWCNDVLVASPVPLNIVNPDIVNRSPQALIQAARAYDTESLIVDQLTHIEAVEGSSGYGGKRNEEVAKIVRTLGNLISTGRQQMPCLLLHQINREGIKAAASSGRLHMTHMAESSEIERTASVAASLYQSEDNRDLGRMGFQTLKVRRVRPAHWELEWQPWIGLIHAHNEVSFDGIV